MNLTDWAALCLPTFTVSAKTLEGYESLLRSTILPHLGHLPVDGITTIGLRGWLGTLTREYSASRVRQSWYLLRAMLDLAREEGYEVPHYRVSLPRLSEPQGQTLTPGQVELLAAACGAYRPLYGDVVRWLAFTGMRVGELAALDKEQVSGRRVRIDRAYSTVNGRQVLSPTKSRRNRVISIPAFLLPVVRLDPTSQATTNAHAPNRQP